MRKKNQLKPRMCRMTEFVDKYIKKIIITVFHMFKML